MSGPIGAVAPRETRKETMARARARAALIPDLLVEAHRVANNVFAGWHGRRKRGVGEDFWQFRHYVTGENLAAIDWRRSARDDNIYVRDREWQATHMVWLWVDESPSMLFRSQFAVVAKQSRALVLAFAMAELLARSGERLGWLGLTRPMLSRRAADHLGQSLMLAPPQTRLPGPEGIRNFCDIVLFSDFLGPREETLSRLQAYARAGARGHLVQIVDPVEETFPYAGRIEFRDPETGERLTAGSAQGLKNDYAALFAAHIASVRAMARSIGWSHTLHHTDKPASQALVALHVHLSQDVWRQHQ
ncbi:MAG: hypothetical protein BroJett030_20260 [Alphaproteobacteria bacterium]|nr:MAG: hypothetical protein BroJett030_20260 [Alphaproteobacteria bacterium]